MMEETRKDEPTLVSEPAAIYYGTSQELRDSGILPELKNFGKEDTGAQKGQAPMRHKISDILRFNGRYLSWRN